MAIGTDDVVVKFRADTGQYERGLHRIKSSMNSLEGRAKAVARSAAVALGVIGVPLGLAVREAQKFELGLAGVQKVAGLSSAGLAKYEQKILNLSKTMPATTAELHETAAAAAILGVRGADNLAKFSETMAKLAVTTDVSGEDAAKAISRIIGLSGEADSTIDQFGSSLVALGNNFKASESEILSNAIRIRQSTAAYKLASHEILALAAVSREAGIRAELVGTSFGRVFRAMDKALAVGGSQLAAFMEITGKTREELERTFKESPVETFKLFVEGMKSTKRPTADNIALLKSMNIQGERMMAVLPSMAKLSHRMSDALKLSNKEYSENNALNKEANAFFATSSQHQKVFTNKVKALAVTVGRQLLPAWNKFLKDLGKFVDTINNPKVAAQMIQYIKAFATLAGAALSLSLGVIAAVKALKLFIGVSAFAIKAFTILGSAIIGTGKSILMFIKWLHAAKTATRLAVGATGIGLLVVAAGLIYEYWGKVFPAAEKIFKGFVDRVVTYAQGLWRVIKGLFTLDVKEIKAGIEQLGTQLKKDLNAMVEKVVMNVDKIKASDIVTKGGLSVKGEPAEKTPAGDIDVPAVDAEAAAEAERERIRLLAEAKEIATAIERENELSKKREFDSMMLQIDQDKYGKELAMLKEHFKNGSIVQKKNAQARLKQLAEQSRREQEIWSMKYDAMTDTAVSAGEIMSAFLGENNALTLAMNKAVAIADIIINAERAKVAAMATSPWTAGQPAVSWITAQQYAAIGAVIAQTFTKPKGAATGTLVPRASGTPATGDHQLYSLTPGELVSPKDRAQSIIEKEAAEHASKYRDNDEDDEMSRKQEVVIELSDDASDFIFAQQRKNRALSIGVY